MAIVQWDPFMETSDIRDRVRWLFGDSEGASPSTGTWIPPVDVYATDDREFLVTVELPDVNRDDIEVTVEDDTLTLRGEKKLDEGIRSDRVHRIERRYGAFRRSFTLPNTIDAAKVQAEYTDGVLTLRLPLREELKPRQVPITVSA